MKYCKILLFSLLAVIVLVGGYFLYMAWAFPAVRCEAAKHLDAPQMAGDCYACHVKATPRVAQEWYESKHGVTLVRCQTCHGMPDGKGSLPFTRTPGVEVCARCHSLSISRMEAKFGKRNDCSSCHPYHQSTMHGGAYQYRQPSAKTEL
ncbi:MAG: hypothetical protein LUG19_07605 [Desulfovibrio sp.]|uniref:hypothetical protein n=1 Tax=Desulfovibrio sp. TaxID=885 RepID=UPI0025880F63|nr:hypothetical protein [Desulfovibrio sp.]MCD7984102.1 hypothetical protein [Desulfovibrio sp.]